MRIKGKSLQFCTLQWRTQDFRIGGVEMPQAPMGWGVRRGIPLPPGGRVWGKEAAVEGAAAPPQKFLLYFFVTNTIL